MASKCMIADCPNVTSSPNQPERDWLLLKLSALNAAGELVMINYGAVCPSCRGKLPELRMVSEQIATPPAPPAEAAPELEAAAAPAEAVSITAADVGPVPDELKT